MTANSKTNKSNGICPKCKTNSKAVTRSGKVSGYCAQCNNTASKLSKSKNHPSRQVQMKVLANEILQISDSLPKITGSKKSRLVERATELLALLNGQS